MTGWQSSKVEAMRRYSGPSQRGSLIIVYELELEVRDRLDSLSDRDL